MSIIAVLERIRAEFREMPGLRLTAAQMGRLCGIEKATCQEVLDTLVGVKVLRVNANGLYALHHDEVARRRVAKAEFRTDARVQEAS
jgi:DNA-binding IclR family transcriptional regulator